MIRKRSVQLLEGLLWLADTAAAPSMSNLLGARDSDRRFYRLADQDYLDRSRSESGSWVYRLTEQGRLAALGGRDPEAQWNRPWDGKWRILMFDLPKGPKARRHELWRWLKENRFGCLQRSVWITPDPLEPTGLASFTAGHPGEFTLMEGNAISTESRDGKAIAASSWDFPAINETHSEYIAILDTCPGTGDPEKFTAWRERESTAWNRIATIDPFLPKPLLPAGYLGIKSWQHRNALRRNLADITPENEPPGSF